LRTKGDFGVRQLAVAFENRPVFRAFSKSASKLAHFESFSCEIYAALGEEVGASSKAVSQLFLGSLAWLNLFFNLPH